MPHNESEELMGMTHSERTTPMTDDARLQEMVEDLSNNALHLMLRLGVNNFQIVPEDMVTLTSEDITKLVALGSTLLADDPGSVMGNCLCALSYTRLSTESSSTTR
jgi:hypothetical protein